MLRQIVSPPSSTSSIRSPKTCGLRDSLNVPPAVSEIELLAKFERIAERNTAARRISFLGAWANLFLARCPESTLARAGALHAAGMLELFSDPLGRAISNKSRTTLRSDWNVIVYRATCIVMYVPRSRYRRSRAILIAPRRMNAKMTADYDGTDGRSQACFAPDGSSGSLGRRRLPG